MRRLRVFLPCVLLLAATAMAFAGCQVIGVAAYKLKPPETIKPKYMNMAGQSIGVMVWADRGLRIDWPTLQLDLANSIDTKLKEQTTDVNGKPKA
jgi:hypothetical protein